ncbi:uncharacterized protein CIMG_01824 [Coccidioides immitis RS]|uniref:Uncharacterized protein n=1 Tax=Coccidioides immitis (strain RS) TaxID=246410 RepID=J3KK07_COCIM|nr:uncharacterized protein CIMG_01824 [Coccidioides immitis RS]EAS36470.3 hypothetical protein CIMG_01824 [Coccidioides immitis RS]
MPSSNATPGRVWKRKRRQSKSKEENQGAKMKGDQSNEPPKAAGSFDASKLGAEGNHAALTVERVVRRYPKLERRLYEPLVLVHVIDPVRGVRFNNTNDTTDDTLDKLRRSFINGIATICDFRKGGDTVTAAALQATPEHTVIWLSANKTPSAKTVNYLEGILAILTEVTVEKRSSTSEEIIRRIIEFCEPRLSHYCNELVKELPKCLNKIKSLEEAVQLTDSDPELSKAIQWLQEMQKLTLQQEKPIKDIMNFCIRGRCFSPTLASLARRETDMHKPITRAMHYVGRLVVYLKCARALVDGALDLPQLLDGYQLRICESPNYVQSPLNPEQSTLAGIVGRMFQGSIADQTRSDLERLDIFCDIPEKLKDACTFRTRVHAELLLVDKFRSNKWEFFAGDRYVGCSKPACFCCYHYINSLPERYFVAQCHNKVYTHWRAPDLTDIHDFSAAKVREDALNVVIAKLRTEVRRCIDDRPVRIRPHFDSITGSMSVPQSNEAL